MNSLQACLMLSLESDYPPSYQLALDMLKVPSFTFMILKCLFGINYNLKKVIHQLKTNEILS